MAVGFYCSHTLDAGGSADNTDDINKEHACPGSCTKLGCWQWSRRGRARGWRHPGSSSGASQDRASLGVIRGGSCGPWQQAVPCFWPSADDAFSDGDGDDDDEFKSRWWWCWMRIVLHMCSTLLCISRIVLHICSTLMCISRSVFHIVEPYCI